MNTFHADRNHHQLVQVRNSNSLNLASENFIDLTPVVVDVTPAEMNEGTSTDIGKKENQTFYTMPSTSGSSSSLYNGPNRIDAKHNRFPHCIVWTPLPCLTWFFPIIGHMGICTTQGIIRDFAGPYYVSEDDMAFGNPVKYWQLDLSKAQNGKFSWDRAVHMASEEYKHRMHNLCCDNCHSHVAMALNLMEYKGSSCWNMVKLCFLMLIYGKYVSFWGFLKVWLPFLIVLAIILVIVFVPYMS
ncbi:transmembrane protein 222 [Plakobranchus ocellatus]|uniref:Transmembrane protein 222 n=1 Tax=Plakobranchus ocellatus TaxID=259542 RepID=A0AAV3XZI5_9GAST|nr:transmembrane protein 222 [Plakobranchus ocellatus]